MAEHNQSGSPKADGNKPVRRSGETVTVACKVPQGIIMQLYEMEEYDEQVMGGGYRKTRRAKKVGKPIRLRGPAVPVGTPITKRIVGGYALTEGVPKDFFEEWLRQNRDSDIVKNNLIFAHDSDTVGMAKEHRETSSGYEPMAQKGDPRAPRPTPGVGAIETDDSRKEAADTE